MTTRMSNLIHLKACFADPRLDVMNFLNEIVLEYPAAISFAPGRPLETLFDVRSHVASIGDFVAASAARLGVDEEQVWRDLGQYNRTNGIIADLIARHLALDEGIVVPPDAIMVTVGAQEAMAVILAGLFDAPRDLLLVSDPTYIGITGLAQILGIRVVPVTADDRGLDPDAVDEAIAAASGDGNVRAVYDIPDFNNPLGTSLPLDRRHRLLDVCRNRGVLLIEDNPYGMFAYDGERPPTLKALDRDCTVIYVGSFSKTLFPSLRVGYLVADQRTATGACLARELSRVKSLITVNTPTLSQAIAGQALLAHGGSLEPIVAPKRAQLRRNRDALLAALDREFEDLQGVVSWNRPSGGLFAHLTLPFAFGADQARCCAREHGVVVCPMQFFTLGHDRCRQIRLSFSCVDEIQIPQGVARLGRFVRETLTAGPAALRVEPRAPALESA